MLRRKRTAEAASDPAAALIDRGPSTAAFLAYTRRMLGDNGVSETRLACSDLTGLNLSQREFPGIDLRGFALGKTNLERSNLTGADLRGVDFATTNCVSTVFCGADLKGANLAFGYFTGANFTGADLRGARLADSLTSGCCFCGADLRGAQLGFEHQQCDFRAADLRGTVIPDGFDFVKMGCDITGALMIAAAKPEKQNMRRHQRVQFSPRLLVIDGMSNTPIGELIDMSICGMRIASPSPLKIDSSVLLRIVLPENCSYAKAISCQAGVVWCRHMGSDSTYQTGFRILKISDSDAAIAGRFMEEQKGSRQIAISD